MGVIEYGDVIVHGNFAQITKEKPENYDEDYKVMVPYPFKLREKIGGVECSCKEVLECFMPYYGFDWYHSDGCELMKKVKQKPSLMNLWCYSHLPQIPTVEF